MRMGDPQAVPFQVSTPMPSIGSGTTSPSSATSTTTTRPSTPWQGTDEEREARGDEPTSGTSSSSPTSLPTGSTARDGHNQASLQAGERGTPQAPVGETTSPTASSPQASSTARDGESTATRDLAGAPAATSSSTATSTAASTTARDGERQAARGTPQALAGETTRPTASPPQASSTAREGESTATRDLAGAPAGTTSSTATLSSASTTARDGERQAALGNTALTSRTEDDNLEGTNTTTTTAMWRPRYAPPYDPNDDPWQHGIFGELNPESERPPSSQQPPQQGTGPLVSTSTAATTFASGEGSGRPTAEDSDEDVPLAPPEPDYPAGSATAEPAGAQGGSPQAQMDPSSSSSDPTPVLNITMSAGIPPEQDRGNLHTAQAKPQQTAPAGGPGSDATPQWHQSPPASARTAVACKIQGATLPSPCRDKGRRPTCQAAPRQARPTCCAKPAEGFRGPSAAQNAAAQAATSTPQTRDKPAAREASSSSGDAAPSPAA